jgi:hypothetical protein
MLKDLRHIKFSARGQECPVQREHSTLRCCGSGRHFGTTRLLLLSVNRVRRLCTDAAFSDATMYLRADSNQDPSVLRDDSKLRSAAIYATGTHDSVTGTGAM